MKTYTEDDLKNATAALATLKEDHGIELTESEALEDFSNAETLQQLKDSEFADDYAYELRVIEEDGDNDDEE